MSLTTLSPDEPRRRRSRTPAPAATPAPVVQADTAAIVEMIARAAADPNTDVDKLERLTALYERITERTAKGDYTAALAAMQPKLPIIGRRGEILNKAGRVQSTYAKWEDINDAIRPVLAAHGFALSFRIGQADGGRPAVTGVLSHAGGHSEETTMVLPVDAEIGKNAVQALGSSVSYGKRYVTLALLNITSRGEDDDGRAAASLEKINDEQRDQILQLLEVHSFRVDKFCRYFGVEAVADLPAKDFKRAIREIEEAAKR
jgi:hypothetical protein